MKKEETLKKLKEINEELSKALSISEKENELIKKEILKKNILLETLKEKQ